MKMPKKGNTVCRHGTSSDKRMNTVELIMFITTNAIARPTAHHPNRVPGRCHKEELDLVVILTSGLKLRRLSLAKPNELRIDVGDRANAEAQFNVPPHHTELY